MLFWTTSTGMALPVAVASHRKTYVMRRSYCAPVVGLNVHLVQRNVRWGTNESLEGTAGRWLCMCTHQKGLLLLVGPALYTAFTPTWGCNGSNRLHCGFPDPRTWQSAVQHAAVPLGYEQACLQVGVAPQL